MPAGFEILDHPADLGFRVWADTMPKTFIQSALALTSVLVDLESINPAEQVTVRLEADDREYLMYNWLSEILYQFDGEGKLFSGFRLLGQETNGPDQYIEAELSGEPYDDKKHQLKTYVKAITLHQLKIEATPSGFEAQVYLDI